MSLYGLAFTAGVALGPAVGGALLATSPDAVWWGGALAAALTGAGLLRLGDRIPDPLLQAQCPSPQAVSAADMDAACHSQMKVEVPPSSRTGRSIRGACRSIVPRQRLRVVTKDNE